MSKSRTVLIVGGGVLGLVSALRLASRGIRCVVLEKRRFGYWKQEGRYFALAYDVVQWLAQRNIIDLRTCWPIYEAGLSMDKCQDALKFSHRQARLPHLGVMVEESMLMSLCIQEVMKNFCIELICSVQPECLWIEDQEVCLQDQEGKIYRGCLCIAADGKNSWVRGYVNIPCMEYNFQQIAYSGVAVFKGNPNTVWDIFSRDQCIGLLPFSGSHPTPAENQ